MNNIQLDFEFQASNNKEYKVDSIWNSMIYTKKSAIKQLPGFYYPVLWKSYFKEENI